MSSRPFRSLPFTFIRKLTGLFRTGVIPFSATEKNQQRRTGGNCLEWVQKYLRHSQRYPLFEGFFRVIAISGCFFLCAVTSIEFSINNLKRSGTRLFILQTFILKIFNVYKMELICLKRSHS